MAKSVRWMKRRREVTECVFMVGLNGCVGMTIPAIFERNGAETGSGLICLDLTHQRRVWVLVGHPM